MRHGLFDWWNLSLKIAFYADCTWLVGSCNWKLTRNYNVELITDFKGKRDWDNNCCKYANWEALMFCYHGGFKRKWSFPQPLSTSVCLVISPETFDCHNWCVCVSQGSQLPWTSTGLLNILKHTRQPSTAYNYPTPNVSITIIMKFCDGWMDKLSGISL